MFNLMSWMTLRQSGCAMVMVCGFGAAGLLLSGNTAMAAKGEGETGQTTQPVVATDPEILKQLQQFDDYLEAGQGAAAMQLFGQVKLKHPADPQVRAYEAKILALQNKMPEAIPVLESVLKDHPNHPLASSLLANIEFRMGKQDESLKRVNDALAVHPKSWELLQIAGEIKMAQKDVTGSLPYWRQIVNNNDNPANVRMGGYAKLGMIANSEGRYAEAANMLKEALDLKWHPSVGMAYIQALDSDKQYEKVNDAIADMRKHLAGNNPQFVQLRQQFETQIVPFETRAKQSSASSDLTRLEAEIADGKITFGQAKSKISALKKTIEKETDATRKKKQEQQLQQADMMTEVMLLKTGIESKYSPDWQAGAVKKIEELAKGLDGPRVDEAMALVKEVKENVAKLTLSQRESVLDLAGKGWTLVNFRYPNTQQLNELKERGLPERYDRFSKDLRDSLKAFYTPLAQKRETLELEKATGEFIQSPGDKALKAKVAKLLTERVQGIDFNKEGVTAFDVIPARIWTEPPGHNRSIDLSEKTDDLRERTYSITSRLGTYSLSQNGRDEALVAAYSRALAVYPRQQTLRARGAVYMYMGRYKEAWEDFAVSVAVAAWEDANAQNGSAASSGNWAVLGIPQVVIMDQIVTGKLRRDGLYPGTSVNAMLVGMQGKNWPAVTDLVMQKYELNSFESRLLVDIRDGRHRDEILDVLVDRYRKATDDETKKAIMAKIDYLQSYHSHTAVGMLRAELEKDPESKTRLLQGAVFADPRNVKANYELGKQYELVKKPEDAMLVYNIAAGGKLLTQTSGLAKEAATARDRLSGPLANINEALKVYEPHMNNLNTLISQRRANKLQASEYEAIMLLFLNYNGNRKALMGRLADGQRAMGEQAQASESLKEYMKLNPDRKGLAYAMMGANEHDLGLYEQAIKSYTAAIEAGYDEAWVYVGRAKVETFQGRYEDAIASFTKALEKKDDNTEALTERSELYEYFFDEYDKAIADLEKALKILKEKNPDGKYFALDLRLNNMKMIKARKALGI